MGESNSHWGEIETDECRAAWDTYSPLPQPGENAALDALCERKRVGISDLVRAGARLSAPDVLAFAFPGGLKFRNLVTDKRWAYTGSTFDALKIIPAQRTNGGPPAVVVAEGETDAARLSAEYPAVDVAVLPAGASTQRPGYAAQLREYGQVYLALDADAAGDAGAEALADLVPGATRHRPPAKDWCSVEGKLPPLPRPAVPVVELPTLVPAGQLLALDPPERAAYHTIPILPIGGTAILHGAYKSFKSWVALDLASALAQGIDWAGFTACEEAVKVGVLQFEIPWAFYRQRVQYVRNQATDPVAFDANFLTYTPLVRPRLIAGRPDSEKPILDNLVAAGVNVAVIDPVRRAMGFADMNAENEVRRVLQFAQRLNDEGIAVIMVHHDNKSGSRHGGGSPDDMTGSGAFAGDADSILSITRPPGTAHEDTRRNLTFLLRNAPSPPPKGLTLLDGRLTWHDDVLVETDPGDPGV
jgi:hypothetical protein